MPGNGPGRSRSPWLPLHIAPQIPLHQQTRHLEKTVPKSQHTRQWTTAGHTWNRPSLFDIVGDGMRLYAHMFILVNIHVLSVNKVAEANDICTKYSYGESNRGY